MSIFYVQYPKALREWPISKVRDLGLKGDETGEAGTGLECVLSSGQMLTLSFENGLVATIRTSGTEPKLKYYTELCATPGQGYISNRILEPFRICLMKKIFFSAIKKN